MVPLNTWSFESRFVYGASQTKSSGLAAAGRAEKGEELAGGNVHGDAIQCAHRASEYLAKITAGKANGCGVIAARVRGYRHAGRDLSTTRRTSIGGGYGPAEPRTRREDRGATAAYACAIVVSDCGGPHMTIADTEAAVLWPA